MTKRHVTQALTAAVLVVALALAVGRKNGRWATRIDPAQEPASAATPEETGPQAVVYAMLDAARAGDVKAYLACYSGQLEAALRGQAAETGEKEFSLSLKNSNAAVKGVAVSDPEMLADNEARVRVEYIFTDRNEKQIVYLHKDAGGWQISRTESGEQVRALIPYGTPVK